MGQMLQSEGEILQNTLTVVAHTAKKLGGSECWERDNITQHFTSPCIFLVSYENFFLLISLTITSWESQLLISNNNGALAKRISTSLCWMRLTQVCCCSLWAYWLFHPSRPCPRTSQCVPPLSLHSLIWKHSWHEKRRSNEYQLCRRRQRQW